MKTLAEIKTILSEHKPEFEKKYFVNQIGIFGSYARGDQKINSDVDVLVSFTKEFGIGSKFITLAHELEELLNMKVDLVSKRGIKDRYLKYVLKDIIYV